MIRVKYVREDGDDTGFADFTVVRGATLGPPVVPDHRHPLRGRAGRARGRWWIRVGGGLDSLTLTTRYAKIMQVG